MTTTERPLQRQCEAGHRGEARPRAPGPLELLLGFDAGHEGHFNPLPLQCLTRGPTLDGERAGAR